MDTIEKIEMRRGVIVEEMCSLRSMRRGKITEQFLNVRHKGKKKLVKRGPYYVLAKWQNGKTVSKRLTSKAERESAEMGIESYKRFVELCNEFEELTERLGELESVASKIERVKKTPKSPSRKTGK